MKTAGFEAQRRSRPQNQIHGVESLSNPSPVPIYFGNVPRGPIGTLRRALLQCLPNLSVLSISFVWNIATEILCDKDLTEKLIEGMNLLGYKHLQSFDPSSTRSSITDESTTKKYKSACYRRWFKASESSPSPVSKEWYKSNANDLLSPNPGIDQIPSPPQHLTDNYPARNSNNPNSEIQQSSIDRHHQSSDNHSDINTGNSSPTTDTNSPPRRNQQQTTTAIVSNDSPNNPDTDTPSKNVTNEDNATPNNENEDPSPKDSAPLDSPLEKVH